MPCLVSDDETMLLTLGRVFFYCLYTVLAHILQRGWKTFALFSHTSGCCKDQAPGTEKSVPKGYDTHPFMRLPIVLADSINQYDHIPFLFFKCLSGKCFVYCNGLMDHICVCENGNSKAWYKAPGHFSGTLVNCLYTICITKCENIYRAAQ